MSHGQASNPGVQNSRRLVGPSISVPCRHELGEREKGREGSSGVRQAGIGGGCAGQAEDATRKPETAFSA